MSCFITWLALAAAFQSEYDQAVALLQQGRPVEALPLLKKAAAARPKDARIWKAIGVVHASGGDYAEAESNFGRACELAPKLEDACYYHGRALYALNRFDRSLVSLEKAGGGSKVDLGKAQALEALGRAAEAESAFRKAVKTSGNNDPSPAVSFGRFLVRQGRFEECAAMLTPVVKRFPEAPEARIHLGRAMLENGRLADAVVHLERAVALSPSSAQAHLLLAKAYVRSNRASDAEPHFQAAARYEAETQGVR